MASSIAGRRRAGTEREAPRYQSAAARRIRATKQNKEGNQSDALVRSEAVRFRVVGQRRTFDELNGRIRLQRAVLPRDAARLVALRDAGVLEMPEDLLLLLGAAKLWTRAAPSPGTG